MSWNMSCPKCGSQNLDLERDRRVAGIRGPHQVQLHCYTCGFVLYGEKAVQEECDRQYTEYLKSRHLEPTTEPERAAAVEPAEAAPVAAAPAPEQPGEQKAPAAQPAAEPPAAAQAEPEAAPSGDFRKCAWKDCAKAARPRSKYCSRNCSNKNARARHAARKS